MPPPKG